MKWRDSAAESGNWEQKAEIVRKLGGAVCVKSYNEVFSYKMALELEAAGGIEPPNKGFAVQ